jgi:hypothetical protein
MIMPCGPGVQCRRRTATEKKISGRGKAVRGFWPSGAVRAAAAFALVSSPCVQAADWRGELEEDKALLATTALMLAADWGQTRNIAAHPERFKEVNPILGPHPSTRRVDAYFAGAMLGTVGLAYVLPPQTRRLVLGGLATLELTVVIRNNSVQIRTTY